MSRGVVEGSERSSPTRALWKWALQGKFRLKQRHRYRRLVVEEIEGRSFVILPNVFNPKLFRTGELLARTLDAEQIPPGSTVLDLGTGSGIGAVFAARWASRVVATDINRDAVRCARINVMLNEVEDKVSVREGNLFEPVRGERFDTVLFNPPYFRGTPGDPLDHAWRSEDVVERFAAGLRGHLAPGGKGLIILSTDGDTPAFLRAFAEAGLARETIQEYDLHNEVVTVSCLRLA